MSLELATYRVGDVRLSSRTALRDGVLEINAAELRDLLCKDPVLEDVSVELAKPGEPVRIVHVLDTVEPRVSVTKPGSEFPGFLGRPETVGAGRTNRLAGVAVMESAILPISPDGLDAKEAIVDMTGPAAPVSPFGKTLNVVLVFKLREGAGYHECDESVRKAGLKAAVYLAETSRDLEPDEREYFDLSPVDSALPRVAYICLLMHEGDAHHMFVYGRNIDATPSLLDPNEFLDGAVVSGDHYIAANCNPTYVHQNNPIIGELYRRHGRDLAFAGVVITKCLGVSSFDKLRSASYAAKLARLIGAQGAVISAGRGGHGLVDLMLNCQEAERIGIRTVLTCFEYAGDEGNESGVVASVPEADAMVSTGNRDEIVEMPAMARVIGGDRILDFGNYEGGGGLPADRAFKTALRRLYCSSTLVGAGHLAARAY